MRDAGPELHTDLALEPAQALRRVAETAEAWGADWSPEGVSVGRLVLPVLAGLRRRWLGGEVSGSNGTAGPSPYPDNLGAGPSDGCLPPKRRDEN